MGPGGMDSRCCSTIAVPDGYRHLLFPEGLACTENHVAAGVSIFHAGVFNPCPLPHCFPVHKNCLGGCNPCLNGAQTCGDGHNYTPFDAGLHYKPAYFFTCGQKSTAITN